MDIQASAIPHSREAEDAVIGSILINPDIFHECRLVLSDGAEEFYIHRHRWVWQAFEKLAAQNTPIDLLTISDALASAGNLEETGGAAFLTALINQVPSSLSAPSYASIVHKKYIRRNMIAAANEIAAASYDETSEVDALASKAASAVNKVIRKNTNNKIVTMAQAVAKADALIEANSKRTRFPGIPTPLIDLNRMMGGGAQKTDVNLIIGRPGQGKTSLLLQMALHAAKYKIGEYMDDQGARQNEFEENHVAVLTCEMPPEQLAMRLASQIANIDFQMLRSGKMDEAQWTRYYAAVEELSLLNIVLEFAPGCKPSHLRARCETLASQNKLDILFVDSLNLMKSDVDFGRRTDLAMDNCAQELKNLAAEFDIPIWAAHQMNRSIEHRGSNSKPTLADMREGGEQPVDGAFFIWHKMADGDDQQEIRSDIKIAESALICEKQRNGPTGEVPVVFVRSRFKFENCTTIKFS